MNVQALKQKVNPKVLSFVVGGLLAMFILSWMVWNRGKSTEVIYKEAKVQRGLIQVSVLATGTVQPENRLEIKSPIAGRIEQVLVKEGQTIKKGTILAWMSSTERAALLDAARSKGAEELNRWKQMYRPTPVIAPIDGMVILRKIEPGQTFTSSDSILVMSDRLTVKAQVDETDISQIKLKQSAEIVLDAYSTQKIEAHVDQIAFEAQTVNNVTTYIIDVLPKTTPPYMRSGMTANVTFLIESKEDALYIPTEALKLDGEDYSVRVSSKGGDPVEKKVQIGITDGKKTEILSGLTEGETVLTAHLKKKKDKGASAFGSSKGGGKKNAHD